MHLKFCLFGVFEICFVIKSNVYTHSNSQFQMILFGAYSFTAYDHVFEDLVVICPKQVEEWL